jgi:hypothetical protein
MDCHLYYVGWLLSLSLISITLKQYSSATDKVENEKSSCQMEDVEMIESPTSTSGFTFSFGWDDELHKFELSYLSVYLTIMCADWLRGPYIYAVYSSYGFTTQQIGTLFITGYFSSMIFGPIVGAAADKL